MQMSFQYIFGFPSPAVEPVSFLDGHGPTLSVALLAFAAWKGEEQLMAAPQVLVYNVDCVGNFSLI